MKKKRTKLPLVKQEKLYKRCLIYMWAIGMLFFLTVFYNIGIGIRFVGSCLCVVFCKIQRSLKWFVFILLNTVAYCVWIGLSYPFKMIWRGCKVIYGGVYRTHLRLMSWEYRTKNSFKNSFKDYRFQIPYFFIGIIVLGYVLGILGWFRATLFYTRMRYIIGVSCLGYSVFALLGQFIYIVGRNANGVREGKFNPKLALIATITLGIGVGLLLPI